jgi:hypothetical protein
VDTTPSSWVGKAEAAIRALRDIEGASIWVEEDDVREIHVLTRSNRPPKQIVRDVQTVLLTRFNRHIDYRVVSVAYSRNEAVPPPVAAPVPVPVPPVSKVALVESGPAAEATEEAETQSGPERIRYSSVNLFVQGPRTTAQVELQWKGLPRMGNAAGWSTRGGAQRLVVQATLSAVQGFLAEEMALGLQEIETLRLGRRRAVVVSLSLIVDRQEKVLVGSCVIEQDVPQAVVLATLAALNRVVGGLRTKEPTEYVLRPTST